MKKLTVLLFVAVLTAGLATSAQAIVFTATGTNPATGQALAASADFILVDTALTIILTNTSAADVLAPTDVLTALFFDIVGFPPATLTPVSASLTSGSTVLFPPEGVPGGSGPIVGGEWAYGQPLSDAPGAAVLGTSSAGFGLFGPSDVFPPEMNLQGPASPDGVQYGIASAGDDPTEGNAAVTGSNALIKNSVTFTLTASTVFSLSDISNVSFQYGTGLSEPCIGACSQVPEPTTLLLLGSGLVGLGVAARRRNRG